jgi:hypothetical protein
MVTTPRAGDRLSFKPSPQDENRFREAGALLQPPPPCTFLLSPQTIDDFLLLVIVFYLLSLSLSLLPQPGVLGPDCTTVNLDLLLLDELHRKHGSPTNTMQQSS